MDEKKVREAIERMCKMRDAYNATLRSLPQKTRERSDYNNYVDAFLAAIEALEKQLAMKPKETVGVIYREFYECKNCGSEIEPLDIYEDYCKWCGQRLDWTESQTRVE